ncbi:hypothetical protein NHH73_21985 [Oxalobacteraceae bacterium OTU3CINTB1]|nr:hypothetical protein NHH73_21985 [Oxalobacteraceae bacterium OTU3CINTB1]
MRKIDDILLFRGDISPFLVHMTKKSGDSSARLILEKIISEKMVKPGRAEVSDIRYGGHTVNMPEGDRRKYFGATCFTETPLDEIHCLLDINYRQINLEPYGLVFLKNNLLKKSVSPVMYLNNETGDKNDVAQALFSLTSTHGAAAAKLLPLLSVFGQKIQSPYAANAPQGRVDFRWEREWRQPHDKGGVSFDDGDLFVGLCPHDEIGHFENLLPNVRFVDPLRPMKWYASKLIEMRQRVDLKYSVV